MNMMTLVMRKLKAFRMTIPSLMLLALASWRTLTSGDAIVLVGVCASIVPFICQFRNFPKPTEDADPFREVLSNYIVNLTLMAVYLAYVLVLTFVGKTFLPSYIDNPHFLDLLLIAVCADVVFVSVLIPICHALTPKQRLMPGIVLCNAMLVFMMMARDYVRASAPDVKAAALSFIALIVVLTIGFMRMSCGEKRK